MAVKETTITGFWDRITFYCGQTDSIDENNKIKKCENKFEMIMSGTIPIYHCPHCGFSVPFYDVEKAMRKISDMLVEAAANDEEENLTNFSWKVKNTKKGTVYKYRILSHKNDKITVAISEENA